MQEGGKVCYNKVEPYEDITTWVYERESFTPCAKIRNGKKYSIISDYLGRPVQAYDTLGKLVWQQEYDIYGKRKIDGGESSIPFRQPGQYEDIETGLYYNRFRYYDPKNGLYLSKDPIGLEGNNPNLYAYVYDSNSWVDVFGLDTIELRHYTSRRGLKGIVSDMVIEKGDQGAVFATRAKGRPLSPADAAEKFKIRQNHATSHIDFEIESSRVEFRTNDLGVQEYKIRGDIELEVDAETGKYKAKSYP